MRKEEYKIKGVERKKFMRGGAKYLPPPRVSRGGKTEYKLQIQNIWHLGYTSHSPITLLYPSFK